MINWKRAVGFVRSDYLERMNELVLQEVKMYRVSEYIYIAIPSQYKFPLVHFLSFPTRRNILVAG